MAAIRRSRQVQMASFAARPSRFWMDLEAQRRGDYQRVFHGIHQGIATDLDEKYQA